MPFKIISPRGNLRQTSYFLMPFSILVIWEIICNLRLIPSYLLAKPTDIIIVLTNNFASYMSHASITLLESMVGLLIAVIMGIFFSLIFVNLKIIRILLYPWFVILYSIPIVAIAPLLIAGFGYSWRGKALIASLLSLFPIVVTMTKGLENVNPTAIDIFCLLGASKLQVLFKLRMPNSIPYLFSSIRISSTLSVVGAIVGEFTGADRGLGFIITISSYRLETARLYAGIFCTAILSLLLFGIILFIERMFFKRYKLISKYEP